MNTQTNANGADNTAVQLNLGGGIAVLNQSIRQKGVNIFKGFNLFF